MAAVVLFAVLANTLHPMLVNRTKQVREIQLLNRGSTTLDLPLMTLYTAPAIPNEVVESTVEWRVRTSPDGAPPPYRFTWEIESSAPIPVRFVMVNQTSGLFFDLGEPPNEFAYYPLGRCEDPCNSRTEIGWGIEGAGYQYLYYEKYRIEYAVSLVTDIVGSSRASFLLVEFSLVRIQGVGDSLPAANLMAPGPGDLSELLRSVHLSPGSRIVMPTPQFDVKTTFRHDGPMVDLDAGVEGPIRAQLISWHEWGPSDDFIVSFSSSAETWIGLFLDLRFGSLLVRYIPPF